MMRTIRRILLLAIAAASLAVGFTAMPATAYTNQVSGAWNWIYLDASQVLAWAPTSGGWNPYATVGSVGGDLPVIALSQKSVMESGPYANQWQWVCVTHRLYVASSASWLLDRTAGPSCGWISPAQTYIRDPGAVFGSLQMQRQYSMDMLVTWQLADGRQIGWAVTDFNAPSDYLCTTPDSPYYLCTTGRVAFGTRDAYARFAKR